MVRRVQVFRLLSFILIAGFIQISGEDNIDCVDIYKQPAFQHDLLKNHKIQERPSEIPKSVEVKKNNKWQTWEAHVSTARCPKGTVPIRNETNIQRAATTSTDASSPHEYAVGVSRTPSKMYGAKATISVWDPLVEKGDELSLSQIWITSGSYKNNDINSIEVGWQSDTYNVTGCYNLQCPGFIQTSNNIVIGGAITPISAFEGKQFEITISVWKDQKSGNWWLSLGSNHSLVGYWPAGIFTSLSYVNVVEWGGEIVNSQSFGRHTTTQMGSGHFPNEGFGKASYFRNVEIVDNNNCFQPMQDVQIIVSKPEFYNIRNMSREDWGDFVFYGGPGFSRMHSGVSSLVLSSLFFYFSFIFLCIV